VMGVNTTDSAERAADTRPAGDGAVSAAAQALADAGAAALTASAAQDDAKSDSKTINPRRFTIETDPARDALLTDFGKETLTDRYLLQGESYQDLFARVADAYADDQEHAQR